MNEEKGGLERASVTSCTTLSDQAIDAGKEEL